MKDEVALISLGMSCQTKHQIDIFVGALPETDRTAFRAASSPFDTLLCPANSAARLLRDGIPVFGREDIEVRDGRAWWVRYDACFWHWHFEFEGNRKVLSIDHGFEREQSKFAHKRENLMRSGLTSARFFWSNTQNNLSTLHYPPEEWRRYQIARAD